jgi:hypothetical protein
VARLSKRGGGFALVADQPIFQIPQARQFADLSDWFFAHMSSGTAQQSKQSPQTMRQNGTSEEGIILEEGLASIEHTDASFGFFPNMAGV